MQPENDASTQDQKRSSFYDVKQDQVKKFTLVEDVEMGHPQKHFSVDLEDGHFEVNGTPVFMHDDRGPHDFRLIFFRRNKRGFNQATQEQVFHHVTYRIGWQYTEEGKNYQQVMEFN